MYFWIRFHLCLNPIHQSVKTWIIDYIHPKFRQQCRFQEMTKSLALSFRIIGGNCSHAID